MSADLQPRAIRLAQEAGFRLGRLEVRPATLEVEADGRREVLEPRVMQVLVALARKRPRVVSRDEMIELCWGGRFVGDDAIQRCVARLRKLAKACGDFEIETVPRVGYRLSVGADGAERGGAGPGAQGAPLLAVLAFDNLSSDPEMAFFSDGVAEEILHLVSRAVRTIGRASSFQFRGADKAVRKVAAELGASHVLDGSVRRAGDTLRVSVELVEAERQTTVWQAQFDRLAGDLFAVQDEVAMAVAAALGARLAPPPRSRDVDPATYEDYLRVRQAAYDFAKPQSMLVTMADDITRRAPLYGRGWLLAARTRFAMRRNVAMSAEERRRLSEEARQAIERATRLVGPDDPELTATIVNFQPWAGAWSESLERLNRARQTAGHDPAPGLVMGSLLLHSGRVSESLEYSRDNYEREPLSAGPVAMYGFTLAACGRVDEALAVLETGLRRWPDSALLWHALLTLAAGEGRWDLAERWMTADRQARFAGAPFFEATVSEVEMLRTGEAGAWMRKIAEHAERTGRTIFSDVVVAAQLGSLDAIYALIERDDLSRLRDPLQGYDPGDLGAQSLFFRKAARFRSDPRFVRLCARLGLAAHWIETDRWPDCADQTPYDFRAACRRERAGAP
jgi:TolB-like protein/DNA-binding winged helix-turn-helix (wHTH) protein